jgi:hypothetical protein
MRTRLAAVAVLALAALACFPAGAGAKPRHHRPPQRWIDFELEGSNGYLVHVDVNPDRELILHVTKEGQTAEERYSAEYMTVDALADTDRVKAKLLGLGSIAVRFHPRGPVRHPSVPGCDAPRPAVQPGVVSGTIKFTGERGYTRVDARAAKAVVEEPMSRCRYDEFELEPHPEEREWDSKFQTESWNKGALFLARKYQPGVIEGGQVLYWAETAEAFESASGRVPLIVYRSLAIPAPASTFDDAHPESMTVTPPPPFSGTAALARTPESVFTWEGNLAVQFPGLDPTPLAGPGFESDYCLRETGCFRQNVESD